MNKVFPKLATIVGLTITTMLMSCYNGNKDLFPAKDGDKWGYINDNGIFVITPQYDGAGEFSEGLATVSVGDKSGFINKKGEFVINPIFDCLSTFCEGLAMACDGEKIGFINMQGEWAIYPQFDYAEDFSDGLAKAGNNGKYGFIDKNGVFVIDQVFDEIWDDRKTFSEEMIPINIDGKWGYYNKKGQMVIKPQFDYACNFSEGLACVNINGKSGFVNKEGKMVIEPQFNQSAYDYSFSDGLAAVKLNDLFGYINKDGEWVITPQFEEASPFTDGIAFVKKEPGKNIRVSNNEVCYVPAKGYLIDKTGTRISDLLFDRVGKQSEGLIRVEINGKWGYVDTKGKMIIEPQFSTAGGFSDGLAVVGIGDDRNLQSYRAGVIDKKGKFVINPQFSWMRSDGFTNGVAEMVTYNGDCWECYLINKSGKIIAKWVAQK